MNYGLVIIKISASKRNDCGQQASEETRGGEDLIIGSQQVGRRRRGSHLICSSVSLFSRLDPGDILQDDDMR